MKALVSPQKKAEWKINKQEFILELQEKYNVIELNEITDIKRHYCYEWTIKEDNHFIEGMLDNRFYRLVLLFCPLGKKFYARQCRYYAVR